MPIPDQDIVFIGRQDSSSPKHLLADGEVSRLVNARFIEGAITNHLSFDEFDIKYYKGPNEKVVLRKSPKTVSRVTYDQLLRRGDIQLLAPLQNLAGNFLVAVISGVLFLIDTSTCLAYDITPTDSELPSRKEITPISYIDNDGGVYGVGGYLVIFNDINRPIFINHQEARTSKASAYEMPPARMGVTTGNRAFIISATNVMWASDPLGGASDLAPLTFEETLLSGSPYEGQIFNIGSALDLEEVTAICRLHKFGGSSTEFLYQNLLVSTKRHKFIIASDRARTNWTDPLFITSIGNGDGIAGPLACTPIGSNIAYISVNGRIKLISQDKEKENSLSETFFDDTLGQYLCKNESNFYFRDWYEELDHSHSIIKYLNNRLYATVYPHKVPAIDKFGNEITTISHRALAIGSVDSRTAVGQKTEITWEGFYDFLNPTGVAILDDDLYVASKDVTGRNRYYLLNTSKRGINKSTIYTRGYLNKAIQEVGYGKSKSFAHGHLYFRQLSGNIKVTISFLADGKWKKIHESTVSRKTHKFTANKSMKCTVDSPSIPLKIDIDSNGCKFELESIHIEGEIHKDN